MGLPKGRTNNRAGKPKGTLNKLPRDLRQSITDFLNENFEEVLIEWGKLGGRDKVNFYKDLLQYAIPKLQNVEIDTDFDRLNDEQLDRIIEGLRNNEQTRKN